MAYSVWLDFGSGFVDYSSSLYGTRPVRRSRAIYNDLKPVISTVRFSLVKNTSLVTALLTASEDIPVQLFDGASLYFTGYVRPTFKTTVNGAYGLEAVEIEAVDLWYKLDRTVGTTRTITNWAVSDPSNKSISLLHRLFYDAGILDSELSLSAIASVVPAITLTAGSGTYRSIIEQILAEAGYSARVSAAGVVSLYDLGPSSITPALTLSSGTGGNLAAGYTLERKEATAEAVDVEYNVTKALENVMLFEDTTGANAGLDATISVPAGTYYPEGAAAGKSVKAAMRIQDYDLVSASDITSNILYSGALTIEEFVASGKNILMRLYSASGAVITRLRGYGDAIVKGDLRRVVRENVSGTTKREKFEMKYLADTTSASRVARIRAARHQYGAFRWNLTTTELSLTPGDYVTLNEASVLGASSTLRVVSVVDGPDPKTISIEAEGVTAYSATAVTTEAGTNQPPSPGPATEAMQAEYKAAIERASMALSLTSSSVARSRAGTLSPTAITMSARKSDGTAYAGRFTIELSHDGATYQSPVYTSSADESSYTYTVPATMVVSTVTYYVASIRVRLYAAGGTATLIRESLVSIALDASASAIYWGPLTTAPTTGHIAGDYYWDDNDSGTGTGGTPRVYNGSAWVEYTSSMAGYQNAMVTMLPDMGAWATEQGEVVAAASALFQKLVTADAFIGNLFTQFITVGAGGRIQYETGSGVQKRAVRLADEKIDWVDIPDTSPASPELLRARIGRLGVGGAILMDGEFNAEIESEWSNEILINAVTAYNHFPCIIETSPGVKRCIYERAGPYIVEKIYSSGSWGSESEYLFTSLPCGGTSPVYAITSDGTLLAAVFDICNHVLFVSEYSGSSWGALTYIDIADSGVGRPAYIALNNETRRILYASPVGTIRERVFSEGSWLPVSSIISSSSVELTYITVGGVLKSLIYIESTSRDLYISGFLNDTWQEPELFLSGTFDNISAVEDIFGNSIIVYKTSSGVFYTVYDGASFTPSKNITADAEECMAYKMVDGNIGVVYRKASNGYIYERTLQRYAKIGAGIIESGSNANGSYVKYGDGTMEQWGKISFSCSSVENYNIGTYGISFYSGEANGTFPQEWLNTPYLITHGYTGSLMTATSLTTYNMYREDRASGVPRSVTWHAIGRWRA